MRVLQGLFMVRFLRVLFQCGVLLSFVFSLQASASSFETQQNNTAIFDGIKGDAGELSIDPNQTLHLWKAGDSESTRTGNGFAYRKFYGEFILTVQLKSQAFCNFGLQIELPDEGGSLKTKFDSHSNLAVELQDSKKTLLQREGFVKNPDVFQVEQVDKEIIFSAANYGKPLKVIARYNLTKLQNLHVGIYRDFSLHDKSTLELKNLRWVIPAWKNFIPYYHFLGSRLEILDVVTGERKVIYETAAGIEAPNWTADGDTIIYNSSGRVYKLYLPTKKISLFNTGFEAKNNNDHIVSFKGKILGITHMDKDIIDNWSVYKLPINGGEPQRLTFVTPSYLHSWSPDGRYILYTSRRNGQFEIYRANSDGTGDELQLTNNNSMDDGSEYTPDGKHIYFNSSRSGAMRLWRMDADGKNPKQVTFDNYNDWFPHISPDGKRILFLSYMPDIDPVLHPYYKQVYLRMMPIDGGEAKIVAYLYGGQGTINVPSWSSDGRYVAFVSNSQLGAEKH